MDIKLIAIGFIAVGWIVVGVSIISLLQDHDKKVVGYEVVEIAADRIVNDIIGANLDHGRGISPKKETEIKSKSLDALIKILESNGYKIDYQKKTGGR